jgi:hypothetical protein
MIYLLIDTGSKGNPIQMAQPMQKRPNIGRSYWNIKVKML